MHSPPENVNVVNLKTIQNASFSYDVNDMKLYHSEEKVIRNINLLNEIKKY